MKEIGKVSQEGSELIMTLAEKWIQEGIEKGRKEGIQEGIKKVAKNAIVKGIELEAIMDLTGLTLEEIRKEMLN